MCAKSPKRQLFVNENLADDLGGSLSGTARVVTLCVTNPKVLKCRISVLPIGTFLVMGYSSFDMAEEVSPTCKDELCSRVSNSHSRASNFQ